MSVNYRGCRNDSVMLLATTTHVDLTLGWWGDTHTYTGVKLPSVPL